MFSAELIAQSCRVFIAVSSGRKGDWRKGRVAAMDYLNSVYLLGEILALQNPTLLKIEAARSLMS
jgi:hypothetical protein